MNIPHLITIQQVVNVSSGDGELAYINSGIAKELETVNSLSDLEQYLDLLCSPSNFDPAREYAFSEGGTPMYALSKVAIYCNNVTEMLLRLFVL
jgi:hypothetical protein